MTRRVFGSVFGSWGKGLDDVTSALALAGLGVYDASRMRSPVNVLEVTATLRDALDSASRGLIPFMTGDLFHGMAAGTYPKLDPRAFAEAWDVVMAGQNPRIEVTLDEKLGIDPVSVVRELSRPEVGAQSVYVDDGSSPSSVRWEWPLRVSYLPNDPSRSFIASLEKSEFSHLFKLVEAGEAPESDLLILPTRIDTAALDVLQRPGRLKSDCVFILGDTAKNWADTQHYVDVIKREVLTSGVGITAVPAAKRLPWFNSMLEHLSGNEPIDVAVSNASRELLVKPPVSLFTRDLLRTNLEVFKKRLGDSITYTHPDTNITLPEDISEILGVPPTAPAGEIGEALHNVKLPFERKTEGATILARTREALESQLGGIKVNAIGGPKKGKPPEKMGQPPEPRLPRHVQAAFFEGDDLDPANRAQLALRPGRYVIGVRIAAGDIGWAALPKAFPEEQLPPSATGHELTVVLYEHPRPGEATMPKPQKDTIHLDPTGDSKAAVFFATITTQQTNYAARIAVLQGNRVLQTMMLRADVVDDPANAGHDSIRLEEIVAIRNSFDALQEPPRLDAAIILNRTDSGLTAVQAFFANQPVAFVAPQDIRDATTNVASLLKDIERREELPAAGTPDELLRTTMRNLAVQGRDQYLTVVDATHGAFETLADATRLQVVEAHLGSFLPLEFFYGREAPADGARVCEHGIEALRTGDTATPCPNLTDQVICPASFWGFSRVIERFPTDFVPAGDIAVGLPASATKPLRMLSGALVGVSEKVLPEDRQATIDSVTRMVSATKEAASWDEWKTLIRDGSPTLLVLLPHSLDDPEIPNMAALEIRGTRPLARGRLEATYVRGPSCAEGPVVLLLGCTTGLTDTGFQNFVSGFKGRGASVVIGTLSKVLGRHAARFVESFLTEFRQQSQVPGARFGDALLRTKQRLLAANDPFALTLLAYGDAGWELQ